MVTRLPFNSYNRQLSMKIDSEKKTENFVTHKGIRSSGSPGLCEFNCWTFMKAFFPSDCRAVKRFKERDKREREAHGRRLGLAGQDWTPARCYALAPPLRHA